MIYGRIIFEITRKGEDTFHIARVPYTCFETHSSLFLKHNISYEQLYIMNIYIRQIKGERVTDYSNDIHARKLELSNAHQDKVLTYVVKFLPL